MSRVTLLLAVVSALGCASASREQLLSEPRRRGDAACSWAGVRWDDRGTLLMRGTALPLGRAHPQWREGRWAGALFRGSLRPVTEGVVLLEGEWRGPGARFEADVDASTDAALGAWRSSRLGEAGVVLAGGVLRTLEATDEGRLLVAPTSMALRHFEPPLPPVLELDCSTVTISAVRPSDGDARRAMLSAAGFAPESPERWLPARAALDAAAQPGGPLVGRFVAGESPARGFVVETRGDAARFVVPEPGGVLWVGWVPAAALVEPAAPPTAAAERVATALPDRAGLRSCARALTLRASVEGVTREVGLLEAGTPFVLLDEGEAAVTVDLALDWFTPAPGVRLSLPREAGRCVQVEQAVP